MYQGCRFWVRHEHSNAHNINILSQPAYLNISVYLYTICVGVSFILVKLIYMQVEIISFMYYIYPLNCTNNIYEKLSYLPRYARVPMCL